jgi:hypothetical protein
MMGNWDMARNAADKVNEALLNVSTDMLTKYKVDKKSS